MQLSSAHCALPWKLLGNETALIYMYVAGGRGGGGGGGHSKKCFILFQKV